MKNVKFRGVSISAKRWIYGYVWVIPGINLCYILTGKIDVKDCSIEKYEVYPESVGQYIGVRDKYGNEVYEGDILEDNNGKIYKIIWGHDLMWLAKTNESHCNCYGPKEIAEKSQIIGNTNNNPELVGA